MKWITIGVTIVWLVCCPVAAMAVPAPQVMMQHNVTIPSSTPSLQQLCENSNALSTVSSLSVTIAASGGTPGCTSAFTSGDGILISYRIYSTVAGLTDLTTSSISVTGASITFTKLGSYQTATESFVGEFMACPSSVTGVGSSIAVTITPNDALKYSGISVAEISGIHGTGCVDQWYSTHGSGNGTIISSTSSSLAQSKELLIASILGPSTNAWTAGACFSGTCTEYTSYATNFTGGAEIFKTTATTAGSASAGIGSASGSWAIDVTLLY